jgi:hypothetical protein
MENLGFLGGLVTGGLAGVVVEQVVAHMINRGQIERLVEEAEKVIPNYLEGPLAKVLDEISKELKDKNGGE